MQRLRHSVTLLSILLLLPLALMAQQGLPDSPKPQNQASGLPDAPAPNRTLPTATALPSEQTADGRGDFGRHPHAGRDQRRAGDASTKRSAAGTHYAQQPPGQHHQQRL